jgi:hypothetical protein
MQSWRIQSSRFPPSERNKACEEFHLLFLAVLIANLFPPSLFWVCFDPIRAPPCA